MRAGRGRGGAGRDGLRTMIAQVAFRNFEEGQSIAPIVGDPATYHIQKFGTGLLQIRVETEAGPRYFQVKITEKIG